MSGMLASGRAAWQAGGMKFSRRAALAAPAVAPLGTFLATPFLPRPAGAQPGPTPALLEMT